jgi:hypothetical protein
MWYKVANSFIIFLMMVQVPMSLLGYQQKIGEFTEDQIKVRVFSIGLSFFLLFEILDMRDREN